MAGLHRELAQPLFRNLRLLRVPVDVRDVRAWLITAVSRICLDQLGSARSCREAYVGPWLPEPIVGLGAAPLPGREDQVTLDESVSIALVILLEALSCSCRMGTQEPAPPMPRRSLEHVVEQIRCCVR